VGGGTVMLRVPDVLWDAWYLIYPLVALFAAIVLFAVVQAFRTRLTPANSV
jgi:hypothetical protein